MTRTSCPSCGATVDIAYLQNGAGTIPLEVSPDSSSDADRYKVVEQNPMTVIRVAKKAVGDFLPDHRFDCPGANAGRR